MTPIAAPEAWLDHTFTKRLAKHLVSQQHQALVNLLGACRESSDPKVTKRLAEWEQIGSFLKQLEEVNADGSTDGDD